MWLWHRVKFIVSLSSEWPSDNTAQIPVGDTAGGGDGVSAEVLNLTLMFFGVKQGSWLVSAIWLKQLLDTCNISYLDASWNSSDREKREGKGKIFWPPHSGFLPPGHRFCGNHSDSRTMKWKNLLLLLQQGWRGQFLLKKTHLETTRETDHNRTN